LGLDEVSGPVVQVMKTVHTPRGGKLCVARVLSGRLEDGTVLRTDDGREAKVSGLFRMLGQETAKRDAAEEGETVALGKVEAARTGDTLSTSGVANLAPLPQSHPLM